MNLWQYWENYKPPFIKICQDIARYKNPSIYRLINYSDLSSLLSLPCNVQNLNVAFRVDLYRICLLYHYGGIWLDSDCVCMKNLSFLLKNLEEYDFVCFEEIPSAGGHTNSPNSFFASRPKGKTISYIYNRIIEKINKKETNKWGEIGGDLISEARTVFSKEILVYPYQRMWPIQPITGEIDKFFIDKTTEEYKKMIDQEAFVYMLVDSFNPIFTNLDKIKDKNFIGYLLNKEHKEEYDYPDTFVPYVIQKGDTFYKLFGEEWKRVLRHPKNKDINPTCLEVGDIVFTEPHLIRCISLKQN